MQNGVNSEFERRVMEEMGQVRDYNVKKKGLIQVKRSRKPEFPITSGPPDAVGGRRRRLRKRAVGCFALEVEVGKGSTVKGLICGFCSSCRACSHDYQAANK